MNLRNVRKQFIGRKSTYACSLDVDVPFDETLAMRVPGGVSARIEAFRSVATATRPVGPAPGSVFHALDATSVPGVDDRKHSVPVGAIDYIEESIFMRHASPVADVSGRLSLKTDDGAFVDATYTGVLRFRGSPVAWTPVPGTDMFPADTLDATAWLALQFATLDTRYHWLVENACVVFGTWTAAAVKEGRMKDSPVRHAHACFDVYSLG
jgi:hypothetical protein